MADNIAITAGSGTTVATDEIGGAHYQVIKAGWGADNAINHTSAADPLPITVISAAANTNTAEVVGDAAHDAAAAGNPVLVGGYASAAAPSDVSGDADAVRAWYLRNGAQMMGLQIAGTLLPGGAGSATAGSPRVVVATDDLLSAAACRTVITSATSYTRPSDTTAYAVGDALSNSTSAPSVLSFTSIASASGKGGVITSMEVVSTNAPATPIMGILHLFDTTVTAVNDNAAFTISDAQMLTRVASIPFQLRTIGANSNISVQNIGQAFTSVGGTTLYGMVELANAYTPASAEVVTFRLQIVPVG